MGSRRLWIFKRRGRNQIYILHWGDETIETITEYKYLGMLFKIRTAVNNIHVIKARKQESSGSVKTNVEYWTEKVRGRF